MTKYGTYLASLERDCPPDWRNKFIRYKQLKKALKEYQAQAAAAPAADGGSPEPGQEVDDSRFFVLLKEELQKVDRCFVSTAEAIVGGFQRTEMRRRLACCFPRLLAAGPQRYADLAERAYWCRKYARANAVALRKILKKHDKQCGSGRGREFLQHCWRLPSGGAFLHSPLLDELKAIQDVLQEQRMQGEDIQLCEVADTSAKGASKATAAMSAAAAAAAATAAGPSGRPAPAPAGGTAAITATAALALPAPPPLQLRRDSLASNSTNEGGGGGGGGCCASHSHRDATVLSAIVESPTFLMNSSDFEWAPEDAASTGGGGAGPASPAMAVPSPQLGHPSLDNSAFGSVPLSVSPGGSSFSPGTSPPGPASPSSGQLPAVSPGAATATAVGGAAALAGAANGGQGARGAPARALSNNSRFKDEELRCPICLDVMYKPVGLACGHKFCKQCALEHAGLGRAIGTFSNLCSYVSSRVACPQCRQPAVYRQAVRMRQLDKVLKARYPQDWEERRQEERARERAVVEAAAAASRPQRSWLHTINARDILLAI